LVECLRVLHLIDHLSSGGAQEVVLNLARHMNSSQFELCVWCLHGNGSYLKELQELGIKVKSLSRSKFNPLLPLLLWLSLKREHFDILNLHLSFSILLGGVVGRLSGVSCIVVTIHALKNQSLPWIFPLWRLLSFLYDKFVAEVEQSVEELRATGIASGKTALIRLGTGIPDLTSSPRKIDHRIMNEKNLIVLNVARLHKHKGQVYLVRAMAKVIRTVPLAKLLIVGDGPLGPDLAHEIREWHLETAVFLLGFRRDLEVLYSSCDVFVLPSVREGMGLATIQAMAYGKPVVACDVGAVSEAVRSGRTGVLVPPRDSDALAQAIIALLHNPEARDRLGRQSQALVRKEFSLERMVQGYEMLYRELADQKLQGGDCCHGPKC